jgi:hypothetical protein
MGYDIHITRRENWFDEDGPNISQDEWSALVAADREMRLDGYAEASISNGSVLRTEDPGIAVWTAYSKHGVDGNMAWFCLINGNVVVKNPDEEMLRKFWSLAQQLQAKVQGDEGETYGPDGMAVAGSSWSGSPAKPWWKFW